MKRLALVLLFITSIIVAGAKSNPVMHNAIPAYLNLPLQTDSALWNMSITTPIDSGIIAQLPDSNYFEANPLFTDIIFTGFHPYPKFHPYPVFPPEKSCLNIQHDKPLTDYFPLRFYLTAHIDSLRQSAKQYLIRDSALRISNYVWALPNPEKLKPQSMPVPDRRTQLLPRNYTLTLPARPKIAKVEQDPWSSKGSFLAQMSQNYTSANWYQGGLTNLAALLVFDGSLTYDDQKKIQFDNSITFRMGIQSEHSDTVRGYSVTDNLIRLSSKYGIKAFQNWYYSFSGEFTTYSLTAFSGINSRAKANGLFSPYRLDLGIGMDYKYKQDLSVLISPISFKYLSFLDATHYVTSAFGVKPGMKSLKEIGSQLKIEYKKKLNYAIDISTRFYFFSNYHHVEIDWETVTNFLINRYLSVRFALHPRFDDSGTLIPNMKPKIQMKELLSFGFAYKFNNIKAKKTTPPTR